MHACMYVCMHTHIAMRYDMRNDGRALAKAKSYNFVVFCLLFQNIFSFFVCLCDFLFLTFLAFLWFDVDEH